MTTTNPAIPPQTVRKMISRCDMCGCVEWRVKSTQISDPEIRRYLKCRRCGRRGVSQEYETKK